MVNVESNMNVSIECISYIRNYLQEYKFKYINFGIYIN